MTPTIGEANDCYGDIEIPKELLITDFRDSIDVIVQSTYPSLLKHFLEKQSHISFNNSSC